MSYSFESDVKRDERGTFVPPQQTRGQANIPNSSSHFRGRSITPGSSQQKITQVVIANFIKSEKTSPLSDIAPLTRNNLPPKFDATSVSGKNLLSRLEEAISQGETGRLRDVLKLGIPLNQILINGETVVHLAVQSDNIKILKCLLEYEPNLKLNVKNKEGLTPLDVVFSLELSYDWFECFVLNGIPFEISEETSFYVDELVTKIINGNFEASIQNLPNRSLILTKLYSIFLNSGKFDPLLYLINMKPPLIQFRNRNRQTLADIEPRFINAKFPPVKRAILGRLLSFENIPSNQRKFEFDEKLLDNPTEINNLSHDWITALVKNAVGKEGEMGFPNYLSNLIGKTNAVHFTLTSIIQKVLIESKKSPMDYAKRGFWNIAEFLLFYNPNLIYLQDSEGKTLFHFAIYEGNISFFKRHLLELDDILKNKEIFPILVTAAKHQQREILLLLLAQKNINLDVKDLDGRHFLFFLKEAPLSFFEKMDTQLKKKESSLFLVILNSNNIELLLYYLRNFPNSLNICDSFSIEQCTIVCMVVPEIMKSLKVEDSQLIAEVIKKFNPATCERNWLRALLYQIPIKELVKADFFDAFLQGKYRETLMPQFLLDRFIDDKGLLFKALILDYDRKWKLIEWLFEIHPLLREYKDDNENTTIFYAISQRNLKVLELYAKENRNILAIPDRYKNNAVEYLIKYHWQWVEGIQLISKIDFPVNKKLIEEAVNQSIKENNLDALNALLELAKKNNVRLFPLHVAFKHNALEIIQALILNGEDVQAVDDNGSTILHCAINNLNDYPDEFWDQFRPIFTSLLSRKDKEGNTPFLLAVKQRAWADVRILKDLGADVNAQNNLDNTCLHLAASVVYWRQAEEQSKIESLISKGASESVLKPNKEGQTPLHIAAKHGYLVNVLELQHLPSKDLKDLQGRTPLALAIENHQFHLIFNLLTDQEIKNYLIDLDKKLPGKVLYRASSDDPYHLQHPCGGDLWLSAILEKDLPKWILFLPLAFHDVHFLHRLFAHMTDQNFEYYLDYLRTKFPESGYQWLTWERMLWKDYEINQGIFNSLPSIQIPKAPSYASFDFAAKALTNMVARIQDENPHDKGFTTMKLKDIKDNLAIFLSDIETENLNEKMTGKKGTPECNQFYQTLKDMLIHLAIFLSDEQDPMRIQTQAERQKNKLTPLPLFDDDHCATVIGIVAKSTQVCPSGRADALFTAYDALSTHINAESSSFLSKSRTWDLDVLLYMDQYREKVVQRIIPLQKEKGGRQIDINHETHIGNQVRSLLKDRCVRGDQFGKKDNYNRLHITKNIAESYFDNFFCLSGLLELMDEGINGRKTADAKRVDLTKIKPALDSEKMIDWLIGHYATPDELKHRELSNKLVIAIENIKKETNEDKKADQKKIAQALANELGVPDIFEKSLALAYTAAVLLYERTKERIAKEFYYDEEKNEWGLKGIAKILMHPKLNVFRKREAYFSSMVDLVNFTRNAGENLHKKDSSERKEDEESSHS